LGQDITSGPAQYHTLLPTISSLRSLALGHSEVPKSSTKGYTLFNYPPLELFMIDLAKDVFDPKQALLLYSC